MVIDRRRFLLGSGGLLGMAGQLEGARELRADVAIIGGGLGGVAAALGALRTGARVVLTEETGWLGGQLTSQGVPPDEHPWIEDYGCTRAYREYRNRIREYYRHRYYLSATAASQPQLNPGNATVSRLSHEPRVSVAVLDAMLAPYLASGRLVVLRKHSADGASMNRDRVAAVTVRGSNGDILSITARYFIDATELGDLLPLTGTEFVTGAESNTATGELHAVDTAMRAGSQSITWCFAMEYLEGEDHTVEQPQGYGKWRDFVPKLAPPWVGRLLDWTYCDPPTLRPRNGFIAPSGTLSSAGGGTNLWTYRRIADRANFAPGTYPSDIVLVNWPQNDFWESDLVTATPEQRPALLRSARELSLALFYWMQTEAGWKGLRLRGDVLGTNDGLAQAPYIREARRIRAMFTVREQHVGAQMRAPLGVAEKFKDTVGVGAYRIDLHPSAGGVNYVDISSLPFQIPLGALIPQRVDNLLAGAKNIGTTHITNGCYRLHPVEWNIGEAAGALAARAVKIGRTPRAIRSNPRLLEDFQRSLTAQGFELDWPGPMRAL